MLARRGLVLVAVVLASGAARSRAEEAYFRASLAELAIAGTLPESQWTSPLKHEPRAVLDGPGEAHFDDPDTPSGHRAIAQAILLIRLPEARDAKGRVFVPTADWSGMVSFRFSLPASRAAPGAKRDFLRAKFYRCETRAALGVPGAAWFRHMSDAARKELGGAEPVQDGWWPRPRVSELEETYGLFSGGRAIAENLQLDRLLPPVKDEDLTVDVSTLQGISVAPIDWKPLVKDLAPPLDPLAAVIPDDQHALFFPSFAAMVDLMDEADASGTPILQLLEPRAEDSLTRARYERQLCLGVSDLARLLGPAVVASAAFTGSDPFLRMGSDVAVIFEARAPEVLKGYLETKHAAALKTVPGARKSEGEAGGLRYVAAVSPDRAVSSYVASRGTTIAVTNSLAQLTRLGSALEGKAPALASSNEYVFFRHRYPRGDAAEKGFLILTDATIRRWCGPVWRIADSRRTRMAAAMAELTARHLDAGLATAPEGPIATELSVPGGGGFRWTSRGPASERYGSGEFMTPIAELEVDRVSPAEASAYERFRTTYQQNWRRFFDPIAARFTSQAGRLGLDITVMPLIEGTEYRDLMDLTRGASLAPEAGDPHPEALLHLALGIRPESRALKEFAGLAAGMVPGLSPNPLGWVGGSLAFYADADPVWDQVARLEDDRGRWFRLPIAFHVASRDPLGLTAFLAALRAFVEQTAPGMTAWEALKHGEASYVKITPSERARAEGDVPEEARNVAVFYAAGGGGLTVTFSEAVLRRALDRRAERSAGKAPGGEAKENVGTRAPAWLGTSVAARVDRKAIDAISLLTEDEYRKRIQERSWSNIAILNEWRRLFPAEDPLKLHERFWGVRLLCPAGGSYVWSEDWATMESTALGHPDRPKDGPALPPALAGLRSAAFGLTFEDQGLRARVEIERETGSR